MWDDDWGCGVNSVECGNVVGMYESGGEVVMGVEAWLMLGTGQVAGSM